MFHGITLNHSSVESLLDDLMRRPGDTYCFRDPALRNPVLHDDRDSPAWRCGSSSTWLADDGEVILHIDRCHNRPWGHFCRFAIIDTWGGSSMDGPPYPVVALCPLAVERQWVGDVDLENWLRARIGADHQINICRQFGAQTNTDESLRKQVDDNLRSIFGV